MYNFVVLLALGAFDCVSSECDTQDCTTHYDGAHVLSDVDDTVICSGIAATIMKGMKADIAGIDRRWKAHVIYAGYGAFAHALWSGPNDRAEDDPGVIFLSARPKDLGSTCAKAIPPSVHAVLKASGSSCQKVINGVTQDMKAFMAALGTPLLATFSRGANRIINNGLRMWHEAMGRTKIRKYEEYERDHPERVNIFLGDNGQGDALAAEDMLRLSRRARAAFIRRATLNPRIFLSSEGLPLCNRNLFFVDSWLEAAWIAYGQKLISKQSLRVVLSQYERELEGLCGAGSRPKVAENTIGCGLESAILLQLKPKIIAAMGSNFTEGPLDIDEDIQSSCDCASSERPRHCWLNTGCLVQVDSLSVSLTKDMDRLTYGDADLYFEFLYQQQELCGSLDPWVVKNSVRRGEHSWTPPVEFVEQSRCSFWVHRSSDQFQVRIMDRDSARRDDVAASVMMTLPPASPDTTSFILPAMDIHRTAVPLPETTKRAASISNLTVTMACGAIAKSAMKAVVSITTTCCGKHLLSNGSLCCGIRAHIHQDTCNDFCTEVNVIYGPGTCSNAFCTCKDCHGIRRWHSHFIGLQSDVSTAAPSFVARLKQRIWPKAEDDDNESNAEQELEKSPEVDERTKALIGVVGDDGTQSPDRPAKQPIPAIDADDSVADGEDESRRKFQSLISLTLSALSVHDLSRRCLGVCALAKAGYLPGIGSVESCSCSPLPRGLEVCETVYDILPPTEPELTQGTFTLSPELKAKLLTLVDVVMISLMVGFTSLALFIVIIK